MDMYWFLSHSDRKNALLHDGNNLSYRGRCFNQNKGKYYKRITKENIYKDFPLNFMGSTSVSSVPHCLVRIPESSNILSMLTGTLRMEWSLNLNSKYEYYTIYIYGTPAPSRKLFSLQQSRKLDQPSYDVIHFL